MFEKVSRSLKYDSNIFFDHKHIYIYQDTKTNHFTPLALRVRGKDEGMMCYNKEGRDVRLLSLVAFPATSISIFLCPNCYLFTCAILMNIS